MGMNKNTIKPRLSLALQIAVIAGPMLSMIDSSVVNVAIPSISTDLHDSLSSVQWTISAYLLSLAAGQAIVAWVARRFGTLRSYLVSTVVFGIASLLCGFAPSLHLLVAARIFQGLGGAALVPLALSLLFSDKETSDGMPLSVGLVLFAAPALGPTIGGLLIRSLGWRSIFFINPIIVLIAVCAILPIRRQALGIVGDSHAKLDAIGLILLSAGLGLLTYGAGQGQLHGWLAPLSAPYWLGGIILTGVYAWWSKHLLRRRSVPILNLSLLIKPQKLLAIGLVGISSVVLYAVVFLAPVYLQTVQGYSALTAGLILLPQGVVMGLAAALGNMIIKKGKTMPQLARLSISGGLILLTIFTLGLLILNENTPVALTAFLLCGRSLAIGLTTQPLTFMLLARLKKHEQADANTLFTTVQRLAGSFGVALLATYYANRIVATHSAVTALHQTVIIMGLLAFVGLIASLWLKKDVVHIDAQ